MDLAGRPKSPAQLRLERRLRVINDYQESGLWKRHPDQKLDWENTTNLSPTLEVNGTQMDMMEYFHELGLKLKTDSQIKYIGEMPEPKADNDGNTSSSTKISIWGMFDPLSQMFFFKRTDKDKGDDDLGTGDEDPFLGGWPSGDDDDDM